MIYDLQGYSVNLKYIMMVTPVFKADEDEGYQFNLRMTDMRLPFRFPTLHEATLAREQLMQAVRSLPEHQASK